MLETSRFEAQWGEASGVELCRRRPESGGRRGEGISGALGGSARERLEKPSCALKLSLMAVRGTTP